MGIKLNKKAIGNFFGTLGKGLLKETASYLPVIGDNVSNFIEEKIGTGVSVTDSKGQQAVEIAGKIIVAGLLIAFVFGYITLDDVVKLIRITN